MGGRKQFFALSGKRLYLFESTKQLLLCGQFEGEGLSDESHWLLLMRSASDWLVKKGARHCCTRDGLSGKWRVQKEKGFPNKAAASTTHPCKKNRVRLSRDYARWGGQENENKRSQFKTRLNSNLSIKLLTYVTEQQLVGVGGVPTICY